MKILIRNIPKSTRPVELISFFTPYIKKRLLNPFRVSGKISRPIICVETCDGDSVIAYHGLISINPDDVAKGIIKRASRAVFKGRRVVIREFKIRSRKNDRRSKKLGSVVQNRKTDRHTETDTPRKSRIAYF